MYVVHTEYMYVQYTLRINACTYIVNLQGEQLDVYNTSDQLLTLLSLDI